MYVVLHVNSVLIIIHTHTHTHTYAGAHNYIAIGICNESYPTDSLPGWKQTSIGYHTDNGSLFISSDLPTPTSSPCKKGDVIRCTVLTYPGDPRRIIVQFFKNDEKVTQVPIPPPPGGFYGAIGMMGGGEKISLSPPMVTRQAEFDHLWEVSTPHTLHHTGEGLCVYTGTGNFTHDSIGTVRAKHPIDLSGSVERQSFEVRIIEPGEHKYIGIGVVCKTYPPNKLPGWKEISVGYHADNGDLFHSCEEGKPTDHPCIKGDVMRCTVEAIDKGKEVAVLFHKNGEQIGRITSWRPDEGFYFCFGMMSRDEKVQVILPEILEPYSPDKIAPSLEEAWVLNQNMEHKGEGVCHYVQTDGSEAVGTLRSKGPLDPFGANSYFDVKIIDPGEKGFIALGVCSEHYPANRLPGWDDLSVGFHVDDGSILSTSEQKTTGESCTKGDVIRCAIQPVDKHDKQVNVTFHKNENFIGKVLFWKPGKGGFFAQVGCMSPGEIIQVASYAISPSHLTPDRHGAASRQRYEPTFDSQQSAPTMTRTLSTLSSRTDSSTSLTSEPTTDDVSMMSPLPSLPEGHEGHPDLSTSLSSSMATASGGINPFLPPRMPHPHHPGMHPSFNPHDLAHFPGHHGNPHDPTNFHHHMYQKWMRWCEMHYFNPHGYHGYPQGDPPISTESGSSREGSTHLTPEPDADTSSPWNFPYPFPPFMDPRGTFPPRRGRGMGGAFGGSATMGPEASRQMSRFYEYAKQVSTASSASDSAPTGFSRENSNEAMVAGKESGHDISHNQPSHQSRLASSSTVASPGSFNEATGSDHRPSPLTRYISQTSNTSTGSSGSQHFSEEQEANEPSKVTTPGATAAAAALSVHSKMEPKKLIQKQLPIDDKSEQHAHGNSTTVSVSGDSSSTTPVEKVGRSEPDGFNDNPLTLLASVDDRARTPEPSTIGEASMCTSSSTTTDATLTSSVPLDVEKNKSVQSSGPRVLQRMTSDFCRQQQESVDLIPKEDNKMFQLLHNVDTNENGSFVRTTPDDNKNAGNSFIMCRLPLSEKMPYFEVEIHQIATSSQATLAVGLVWENYPVFHLPGSLPGSIALHSNGSLNVGGYTCDGCTCKPVTSALVDGDIIGCQAQLRYKSEVSHHQAEEKEGNSVKVELFKNGLLLAVQDLVLPPNGLHPAVGFTGHGTCIKINQNIQLSPKTYFQTHTLPKNFVNFTPPTAQSRGWHCLKNATVSDSTKLTINEPHSGLPAVVQHSLPFSMKNSYFEIKLDCHVSAFSVLSIGALPQKSTSELSTFIPGEAASSVGFLPLIGFIMRDGVICTAIPEAMTSSLYGKSVTIGVGIDFRKELSSFDTSISGELPAEDRVLVFFTISGQLVSSMYANLPKGGFYPTLAVDSTDSGPSCSTYTTDVSVAIHFPKLWPKVDNLPYGFVRGAENDFLLQDSNSIFDAMGAGCSDVGSLPVRALQAAIPLSRSNPYFEIRIVKGGGTYCISIGLASYSYDLTKHPGWRNESIAFHADDGNLFIDSNHQLVAPPCQFNGTILGCGARFPEDGNTRFAEVYFTVNRSLVARKFVKVPHLGFFPTIGMRTKGGVVSIDLNAPDPCEELKFSTVWGTTENMKVEGNVVSLATNLQRIKRGAALLSLPISKRKLVYFKGIALSEIHGTVMVGITTTKQCPHNFCESQPHKSCILNLANGKVMIYDKYFQSKESCVIKKSNEFGCGLEPLPNSEKEFLLFFTCDDQVVFCSTVEIDGDEVYPIILMMETTTQLKLDACAMWPNMTAIGPGWARFANIKVENSVLSRSPPLTQQCLKKKIPVGFAQAATPLTPTNPYFEIEVISRAGNKSIALGLASRRYPINSYVGWHEESIGYHLDDGKLFKAFKHGHSFGPKVFAGNSAQAPFNTDTIGCGIRFDKVTHAAALRGGDNLEVFFTINGGLIGTQKFVIPCGGAFPTICLESPSESVIYHHHSEVFPPVSRLVDPRVWGNAYSVCQADRQIRHLGRHKEISGGLPKAFCQAKEPFSPYHPYFELEIVGLEATSVIHLGPATHIPLGCTSPNTHSIFYSSAGQTILRKADQKYILGAQKCGLGDKIGCAIVYEEGMPVAVEFYVNKMIIKKTQLSNNPLRMSVLYPTVILTHPGDAIIPTFHHPTPVSETPFLVGWLRMERVKVKSAIVEYTAPGKSVVDVGVAQASYALNFNSITYYEIEILNPGQKCTISIGVAASDYSLNSQPGWRENSVAVHGDDGRLFQNSGMGTAFGPPWKKYDVIGLGIRSKTKNCMPYSKVQVYFTRNGEEIGHTTQMVPPSGLFPTVGMHSPGEKVKVHIGTQEATPNSYDPLYLEWQILCGVDLKKSPNGGAHILSYKDCGRNRPKNIEQLGIILSLAIGHQQFSEEMHYFEMEILSKGRTGIAIGVVPTDFPLQEAPGWSHGSVAYHTDDGALYNSSMKGKDFGPVPHIGDVIGCGVELMPNNTKFCFVFFTYNGFIIGRVRATLPEKGFYPGLALTTKKDRVAVRFMETFKPKLLNLDSSFIGVMRINNCSYSHQIVQFMGTGNSGFSLAPAMAQFAIPMHNDRRYFAANIVRSKDVILIGLAIKDYPMKYAPGTTSISIAYDTFRGNIKAVYGPDNFIHSEAPVCRVGDTVGCGISLNETESKDEPPGCVFFTRNGTLIKTVTLIELMEDLYPVVGFIPEEKSSAVFMDWNVPMFEPMNSF